MSFTYTDIFCGAGGSSIGLEAAGFELRLAANHWQLAIETHAANFRDADHLCADLLEYDYRRLPRTDVLWASPECTWHSPAGGRRRPRELDLLDDYVPNAAAERSRMTMLGVLAAADVHGYKAIVVENVVEAAYWTLFGTWLHGFRSLGYEHQILCASSAHVYSSRNAPAPQWRDRLYVVFTKPGISPDLAVTPPAWCEVCGLVEAQQRWKAPKPGSARAKLPEPRVGKYRQQYVYVCPAGHEVEPYVSPAASAIDWTDLGTPIRDRSRPLAEATMRRIRLGYQMFGPQPNIVAQHGNTWERPDGVRAWPTMQAPLTTRCATDGQALATPPGFLLVNRTNNQPIPTGAPFAPFTTGGNQALVSFLLDQQFYRDRGRDPQSVRSVGDPLRTVLAGGKHHALVIAVNHGPDDGLRAYPPEAAPLRTASTKIGDAFLVGGMAKDDWPGRDASQVHDPDSEPLRSLLANGRGHHALVVPMRRNGKATPAGAWPLQTIEAGGNHHAFLVKQYAGNCKDVDALQPTAVPLGAITTQDHHWLVIPYRRGRATTTGEPLHALGTLESAALVEPGLDEILDSRLRMLKAREHLRGQRFPDPYIVYGNGSEQTMLAGNAVSANVAQHIGERLQEALA